MRTSSERDALESVEALVGMRHCALLEVAVASLSTRRTAYAELAMWDRSGVVKIIAPAPYLEFIPEWAKHSLDVAPRRGRDPRVASAT